MSKVFMPHPILRMTESGPVPKFPMGPARAYGEVLSVFGSSEMALMPDTAVEYAVQFLHQHDYDPEQDYLLIGGDPAVYGLLLEAALVNWGMRPKLLRWDREKRGYDVLPCKTYRS